MESLIRGRRAVIAVVDAEGDDCWVWWVNTSVSPEATGSRKTGAWDLSKSAPDFAKTLEKLLYDRMVVATADGRYMVEEVLGDATKASLRWVDLGSTLNEVRAIRDEYQKFFDSEQERRTKSNRLRELRWPASPDSIDVESPPTPTGQSASAGVVRCLAIAEWIDRLVRGFEDIEANRADRESLRSAFAAQNFPVVATASGVG